MYLFMFVMYLCLCCIYVFDVSMFVMNLCLWCVYVCYVYIFCIISMFIMYLCLWCIIFLVLLCFWWNICHQKGFVSMYVFDCFFKLCFMVCVFLSSWAECFMFVFVCLAEYSFVSSVCFTCLASFLMRCLYLYYGYSCVFTLPVLLFAFIIGFVYVVCICFPVSIWAFLRILVSIQYSMCE